MKGLKKKGILPIVAAMVFGAPVASYAIAPHGVKYTKHNIGSTHKAGGGFYSTNENEVCIFCHTPHNATNTPQYFLWNRIGTTSNFQLYTASSTLNMSKPGNLSQMSRMCMTCHDGATALNSMANPRSYQVYMVGYDMIGDIWCVDESDPGCLQEWGRNIGEGFGDDALSYPGGGGVLVNDHPVSFEYQSAISGDGTLKPTSGGGSNVGGLPLWPDPADSNKYKLECMTCHDPHINYNSDYCPPEELNCDKYRPFLRKSNASSSLCFTCHDK